MNEANLHEALLALMAAAITASIFTIGFSSARHHHALRQLRQAERDGESYAALLLEDEAGWIVAGGNTLLWVLVVAAACGAAVVGDVSITAVEVILTLAGFVLVESTIVALGWLDHRHVRKRARSAHSRAAVRAAKEACEEQMEAPASA